MIHVAIIGYGYWGPNLVRNFSAIENCQVAAIVDLNAVRLQAAQKAYPHVSTTPDLEAVLRDPQIDAVVIATPVLSHYPLAKAALQHQKHVLIEKPLTDSTAKAVELIELARRQQKCLMVDHTFLYTGAVKKMKALIAGGALGNIQYFDSVRINLGLFQSDINVIWDLAAHDVAILQHLIPEPVSSVVATGISHTANQVENIAYLTLYYPSNTIAHVTVSWTSPVKIRKILIGGTQKMLVFDDLEPTEKVRIYDTRYQINSDEAKNKILVDYRIGDVMIPKVEMTEALKGLADDFLKAITTGTEPLSNAQSGLAVVRILEAADQSLKQRGKEVVLETA
jgi:predicted dehydrogenase